MGRNPKLRIPTKPQNTHTFICGITGSGKTTMARFLAIDLAIRMGKEHNAKPAKIVALDPVGSYKDIAAYATTNEEEFRDVVLRSNNLVVIIDEAGESLRNPRLHPILTRGRGMGHFVLVVTQRTTQVPPTCRTQCQNVVAFRQRPRDAALVGDVFGLDEYVDTIQNLPQFSCLSVMGFDGKPRVTKLKLAKT